VTAAYLGNIAELVRLVSDAPANRFRPHEF
jgi:hypothetical protein